MKLNFIKNIQLDVKNWQNAINVKSYNVDWERCIPENLTTECINTEECLINYLKKYYYNFGFIDLYIKRLIKKINVNQIQTDLENLMSCQFPNNTEINVLITTFVRAPYNIKDKFFYLRYRDNNDDVEKSITNIYHELMHFLFHWNYWDKCQSFKLKENQIHDIKESFTILLNSVLIKRNLPIDKGYKIHQDLREQILDLWQKNNNFKYVLKNIIKFIINKNYKYE